MTGPRFREYVAAVLVPTLRRPGDAVVTTHDCHYELTVGLADARREGAPTIIEVEDAFEATWKTQGPVEYGYVGEYGNSRRN